MKGLLVKKLAHFSEIPVSANIPEPLPQKDEVLVDVYSAGLNFFDILQLQGKYQKKPPLPFVGGAEFSGRISQNSPIPEGCQLKPGDRVFGVTQGSFAERCTAKCESVLPLPSNLSFNEGAGLYVTWPTSYEALVGRAELKPGEWVLITAAAGGVGIVAVQIAKAIGARVIAAAGSDSKLDITKKYGADYVVNYSKPNWQKEVLKITGGKGVNVIYDPVGMIKDCLKCIAWKGRALVIGFAGGEIEKLPLNLVLLKNISVLGLHWGAYAVNEPQHITAVWEAVLELLSSGRVKPVVFPEIYPLENIGDGLASLAQRKTWGKATIQVREDDSVKAKL